MAPYYPWWGPMCVFPTIVPIIILLVLIIVLCLVFGRRGFCSPWHGPTRLDDQGQSPESGLEILKKRCAKGEITKEEFEQMQKDILN